MIYPDQIGGEQDFAHYYHGLMHWLDRINQNHRPCHYAIKSQLFDMAYTFNFVVPAECPAFFYDRNAEVPSDWTEYDMDGFVDVLPEPYAMELETALVVGLLNRIRDHGTGPATRFFTTTKGACWMVSARMMAIIGTESMSQMRKVSKDMPNEYQPGVSYSTTL